MFFERVVRGRVRSLSSWRAWIEMSRKWRDSHAPGRSPHGERGLKCHGMMIADNILRRSPHGERGLKFVGGVLVELGLVSLSSWRAWIEIPHSSTNERKKPCRSPHGERGLKYDHKRRHVR